MEVRSADAAPDAQASRCKVVALRAGVVIRELNELRFWPAGERRLAVLVGILQWIHPVSRELASDRVVHPAAVHPRTAVVALDAHDVSCVRGCHPEIVIADGVRARYRFALEMGALSVGALEPTRLAVAAVVHDHRDVVEAAGRIPVRIE
jgi:hypothetical protein